MRYSLFLEFFFVFVLTCSLDIICYKRTSSLNLITGIKQIKNKSIHKRNRLYSSNENLKRLKYIREVTNASIQVCNDALKECNNDVDKAIELVRKNTKNGTFISTSVKTQKEGLICSDIMDDKIVLIELLTDSDFVARNNKFVTFLKNVSKLCLHNEIIPPNIDINDSVENFDPSLVAIDKIMQSPYTNANGEISGTVSEELNYLRNIFREDIKIGRFSKYVKKNENEFLHFYIHNIVDGNNVGLSGVMLVIEIDNLNENLKTKEKDIISFANDLCMHIISAKPVSVSIDKVNQNVVKKEMDIIRDSLKDLNKPENIVTNMINGKMKKFYSNIVLLEQEYMLDDTKRKVSQVIKDFSKNKDLTINVKHFDNFIVGEKNILM
ncbi:elongation factor Ts, mitochondrial [Plasmodium vinckei petteri]|uniref:Elongation factor Ts, mitochondrial n=2 Tax=Plasmodium vinckei TaxID=5860 RepID=W7AG98_PLAVN|nr:elongation factor Ts, mitochondrial [Plasmodium vinckei petteri]CAD2086043.1 elongation factor (EF-TS), putative [Plasmodium vinckei lentum]CAD2097450.1 elongation factor (EF-TS), putative [Plasmodium vinckei petteri]